MSLNGVLQGLERREVPALARAISLVENQRQGFEELLSALHPRLGGAHRIGLTGPPGAGKSTLVERLVRGYREQGLSVGVVAVDPTSPFTGGALLGDRIRMESVSLDPGVFIRSMATRGALGGLATTTREVADVLDAFGFDRVLIETVGVGQSEWDVANTADSTVVVLVPESGDGIQTLKAGLLEAADVFVVNKRDRPGADKLRHELQLMLAIRRGAKAKDASGWEPPVLGMAAAKGEGVAELAAALDRHWGWLRAGGELAARRRRRLLERTREVVNRGLRHWIWDESPAAEALERRMDDLEGGDASPYDVAQAIIEQFKSGAPR
ncbi:MAG: methylmalonyl Co-A mutase-associated GTPase MeaB [Gemmatimonadales bacterium]